MKIKNICLVALCSILSAFAAPTVARAEVLPVGQTGGWQLTFEDEFNGTTLDVAKWQPQDLWCGIRNNELQAYQPENARVSGGFLHLVAEKRSANLDYCGVTRIDKRYASGIAITMDKFDQKYGYFEAKIKVPKGNGLWPAFWMMPYHTWPPEIDIMEILGRDTKTMYMTNHWGTASNPQKNGGSFAGIDFSADFHVFGAKWTASDITWYVDGTQRFRSTSGIPSQPFFMMLNLAVGGSWPGSPDSSTPFPSEMLVDYARAWRPVSCSNDCPAVGQKKCNGDNVQTCEISAGCLKWGVPAACGAGQTCENGTCRADCVPKTCGDLGYGCGETGDGCGNNLNCGVCGAGQTCENGTCRADCVNECSIFGARQCSSQSDYRICGNYDIDECSDWSAPIACEATQFCSGEGSCSSSCDSHCSKRCYSGDVYWYNCCGIREDLHDRCADGEICSKGECAQNSGDDCVARSYKRCHDGDVYWYDSCGARGVLHDRCAGGEICAQGECARDNDNDCRADDNNCDNPAADHLTRQKIMAEIAQIKQLLIELIGQLILELQNQLAAAVGG